MQATDYESRTIDDGRRLRLVVGGRRATVDDAAAEPETFAVSSRAGDRHEPWTLQATPALERVATVASRAGIDFDLAVRLCVESALAAADLRETGLEPAMLDRAALGARVGDELEDRDAAYLRRLVRVSPCAPRPTAAGATVGLPVRLTARLLGTSLDALLETTDPVRAVAWELSALLEGRTISEWAPLAALREVLAEQRA
jgi:hypothetical protein